MRKLSCVILFVFLSFGIVFGQTTSQKEAYMEYPEAKAEVKQAMTDIQRYIRNNETDKLIAMHAYGPKFTEFEVGGRRQGSKENEEFERNFLGTITNVEKWNWEDLQINVFGGDVANVTFHSDFKFSRDQENYEMKMQGTLLFIKTDEGWKITHEHLAPLNQE